MVRKLDAAALARKEKREARRAKQRQANVGRAEKMHIARIENSEELKMPALKQRYYIGCSGWFYWDWRGVFIPTLYPPAIGFLITLSILRPLNLTRHFIPGQQLPQ